MKHQSIWKWLFNRQSRENQETLILKIKEYIENLQIDLLGHQMMYERYCATAEIVLVDQQEIQKIQTQKDIKIQEEKSLRQYLISLWDEELRLQQKLQQIIVKICQKRIRDGMKWCQALEQPRQRTLYLYKSRKKSINMSDVAAFIVPIDRLCQKDTRYIKLLQQQELLQQQIQAILAKQDTFSLRLKEVNPHTQRPGAFQIKGAQGLNSLSFSVTLLVTIIAEIIILDRQKPLEYFNLMLQLLESTHTHTRNPPLAKDRVRALLNQATALASVSSVDEDRKIVALFYVFLCKQELLSAVACLITSDNGRNVKEILHSWMVKVRNELKFTRDSQTFDKRARKNHTRASSEATPTKKMRIDTAYLPIPPEILQFCDDFTSIIINHFQILDELQKSTKEEEISVEDVCKTIRRTVLDIVFVELEDIIALYHPLVIHKQDIHWQHCSRLAQTISPSDIGIAERFLKTDQPVFQRSIEALSLLREARSPYSFEDVVLLATRIIHEEASILSTTDEFLDADTIVPIIEYCICQAEIPNIFQLLNIAQLFESRHRISGCGEGAYYLTCLEMAAQHISLTYYTQRSCSPGTEISSPKMEVVQASCMTCSSLNLPASKVPEPTPTRTYDRTAPRQKLLSEWLQFQLRVQTSKTIVSREHWML